MQLFFTLITFSLFSCQSMNRENINDINIQIRNDRFELAEDKSAYGTSLFKNREINNPKIFIGDFLSKLWSLYGKPESIFYEGFSYTIRDKETGVIFTAYCSGSGPAYGGFQKDFENLNLIITDFEELLLTTPNADCEIEFETDFGVMKCGSEDGKPYNVIKN